MPVLEEKLRSCLLQWKEAGSAVSCAIVNEDFEACRRASAKAASIFKAITELIDDGAELAGLRQETLDCVALWRRNIKAMPAWMEEVQLQIKDVQQRIAVRQKLGGVYGAAAKGPSKRSGIRLKVKAR